MIANLINLLQIWSLIVLCILVSLIMAGIPFAWRC